MTKILAALDAITTAVLAYRRADKGQAAATIERRVKDAETQEKKGIEGDFLSFCPDHRGHGCGHKGRLAGGGGFNFGPALKGC